MHLCTVHVPHKLHFLSTFSLKIGPTALFTHLKIILLQYFQFLVFNFNKISFIQIDPLSSLIMSSFVSIAQEFYLLADVLVIHVLHQNKVIIESSQWLPGRPAYLYYTSSLK